MVIEVLIVLIAGVLCGGVVNVLADDLPLRVPPRTPRYISDEKKRAIHMQDEEVAQAILETEDERRPYIAWLGITAFLFGKRTSPNGVKLSWRYPITEIFTASLMLLTLHALNNNPDLERWELGTVQAIIWMAYMVIFAIITVIDIEHKLILFVVIIPASLLALFDTMLTTIIGDGFFAPNLSESLLGGALGFAVFFIMYNGGFMFTYVIGKLRGRDVNEIAFGYGDVMMAFLSGLILGWRALIFAMFITVFLGAFGALIYILTRRIAGSRYSAFTAIPYGPYIVAGTLLLLLYRQPVIDFLLSG